MKKFSLFLALFAGSVSANALDYTNNVRRYWDDSSKSAFRIKKANNSIQFLNYINLPIQTGIVTTGVGGVVVFNNAASPTLVLDTEADGEFSLSIADGVISSISFQIVLPSDYDNEGDLEIRASSETNVTTTTKISARISINNGSPVTLTETAIGAEANTSISTAVSGLTALAAGDKITIQLGRNDSTSGTGTLVIHSIGFKYNESIVNAN